MTIGVAETPARLGERRRYKVEYVAADKVPRLRGRLRRVRRGWCFTGRVGVFVPKRKAVASRTGTHAI